MKFNLWGLANHFPSIIAQLLHVLTLVFSLLDLYILLTVFELC